jgi:hypothetical protein
MLLTAPEHAEDSDHFGRLINNEIDRAVLARDFSHAHAELGAKGALEG